MAEEWRVIAWAPDYEVSDHGRVRRLVAGRFLPAGHVCPTRIMNRYVSVNLRTTGPYKPYLVHVLVCEAFHGPKPTPKHHCAHWDGNPLNNRADNLRWASPKENCADRKRHGTWLAGSQKPTAKLVEAQVHALRSRHSNGENYLNLAAEYGINRTTVLNIVSRRTWRHV